MESLKISVKRVLPRRRAFIFAAFLAAVCLVPPFFALSGCYAARTREYSRNLSMMGTFVQVKVSDEQGLGSARIEKAMTEALSAGAELEKKLSIYDPAGEVSTLNRSKSMKASPELFGLIALAAEVGGKTSGAFDITVAPALKARGFYADMPEEIRRTIPDGNGGVGWRNVSLDRGSGTVILRNGAWIDLSGIAKGYIADMIAENLSSSGAECFLVNAGGEIRCGGGKSGKKWRIGIQRPGGPGSVAVLALTDAAVATSGDYENFIVDSASGGGVSHIVDPGAGAPMDKKKRSVTVITKNCAYADALATGMMVLGTAKSMALADELGDADAIFVETVDGKEVLSFSKGAGKYLIRNENRI